MFLLLLLLLLLLLFLPSLPSFSYYLLFLLLLLLISFYYLIGVVIVQVVAQEDHTVPYYGSNGFTVTGRAGPHVGLVGPRLLERIVLLQLENAREGLVQAPVGIHWISDDAQRVDQHKVRVCEPQPAHQLDRGYDPHDVRRHVRDVANLEEIYGHLVRLGMQGLHRAHVLVTFFVVDVAQIPGVDHRIARVELHVGRLLGQVVYLVVSVRLCLHVLVYGVAAVDNALASFDELESDRHYFVALLERGGDASILLVARALYDAFQSRSIVAMEEHVDIVWAKDPDLLSMRKVELRGLLLLLLHRWCMMMLL
jgi:hypothetical protein